jgi:uncharacterized protein YxjI
MTATEWPAQFKAEKPFFNFFGRTFRIHHNGQLSFYVRQKMFRLKEAIKVYSDDSMNHLRLEIQARSVIDFSATYDVTDSETGAAVGSLSRQGFKSMVRDTWTIRNASGDEIGMIQEDSRLLALLRRFMFNIIPQTFNVFAHGQQIGAIRQRFNLLKLVFDVDLNAERLDPRLGVAASVLLLAIEGRQN